MHRALHWLETHPTQIAALFFACFFIVGSIGFKDYGVSWDEPGAMQTGQIAYEYVTRGVPYPADFHNRSYGTVFDLPVFALIDVLGLEEPRSMLLFKHFMTFFIFFLGVFVFFLLGKRHFRNSWMGLLGAVFLVFSPRIFGEAFYNPKDIPHLAFFIFAIYTLTRFLEEKDWKWVAIHALVCALAVGVRMTSIIIPVLTLFFLAVHAWRREGEDRGMCLKLGIAFVLGWMACLIAVWPFLWENPVGGFLESYRMMTSYAPEGFFMGEKITGLPWLYVPVWIVITTPLLYSVFFLAGFVFLLKRARRPLDFLTRHTNEAIFGMWFVLPIAAVYASGAGIYDGWRHLYFVYPGFLMIALLGVRFLLHVFASERFRQGFIAIVVLHTLWLGVWMWRYHPVQSAYFSIPAQFVQKSFELDYWGLSFRPAFERLLELDASPVIPVWATSSPAYSTLFILPEKQRSRILMVEEKDATYVLNNYRFDGYKQDYPHEEIDRIMVGGVKVLGIYKLR